jgi:hypothetical protein
VAYAILRIRKLKSWQELAAAGRHNDRQSRPANADPAGRVVQIVGNGDVEAEARAKLREAGIDPARLRKNAVLAIEAIITASPAYFRPGRPGAAGIWDQDQLNAWLDCVRRFLAAEWGGSRRIVSVTLHLDEATPHCHVVWLPIDDTPRKRGPPGSRLNAARWLDGRSKLSALQDRYAAAMAELGIERGARGSRAHHHSVRQMYGSMERDAEAAALARRQAEAHERQARTLRDQAEAIYRQAALLLPALARSVLAEPIRRLGVLLRQPVARAERQNQLGLER